MVDLMVYPFFRRTPLPDVLISWPGSAAARSGACPLDPAGWLVLRQDDLARLELDGAYRTVDRVQGQCRITVSLLDGTGWRDVSLATTGRTLDPVTNCQPNTAKAETRLRGLRSLPEVTARALAVPADVLAAREALARAGRDAVAFERELTRERLDRARCLVPKAPVLRETPATKPVLESAPGVPVLIRVASGSGRTLDGKPVARVSRKLRVSRDPACGKALAALLTAEHDVFVTERLQAEDRSVLRNPWDSVTRNMVLAAKARLATAREAWLAAQMGLAL